MMENPPGPLYERGRENTSRGGLGQIQNPPGPLYERGRESAEAEAVFPLAACDVGDEREILK
jgi:hypothetical protein